MDFHFVRPKFNFLRNIDPAIKRRGRFCGKSIVIFGFDEITTDMFIRRVNISRPAFVGRFGRSPQ
jgi:hypothetical protein